MLPRTALASPVFMARVKLAAVQAVKSAKPYPLADNGTGKARYIKFGHAEVLAKRTGKLSLIVAFHSGHGLSFIDGSDRDVTDDLLAALRSYHADMRKLAGDGCTIDQALPLITIDYDSGPLEGLPVYIRPSLQLVQVAA